MKTNYTKSMLTTLILIIGLIGHTQNIQFTFANAQNTNDGVDDYYEVDVMIQTVGGQADFKLGSGQLYFNYNTTAFGDNVFANGRFSVSADYGSGYFLGELSGFTNFYDINTLNDNTISRVSWSFSQGVSSGAMTEVVNVTPKKLIHLKVKYLDVNQNPMLTFEDDETLVVNSRDQFYTACGPYDSASTTLDCTSNIDPQNLSIQFLDANFDNTGATLSNEAFELFKGLQVYPNPARDMIYISSGVSIEKLEMYDMIGKLVLVTKQTSDVNVNHLQKGLYLLKLYSENASTSKKVIIE